MTERFLLCKARYEHFKKALEERANAIGVGQDESVLRKKSAELLGGEIDNAHCVMAEADDEEGGRLWFEFSVPSGFKCQLKHLRYVEYINGTLIQKTIIENILAEWEDALKDIENYADTLRGRWPWGEHKTTQTYWNRLGEENKAKAEDVYSQGPDILTLDKFIRLLSKEKAPSSPINHILKAIDGGINGDVLWDKFEWYFNSDIDFHDEGYSLFIHAINHGLRVYDTTGNQVDSSKLIEACQSAHQQHEDSLFSGLDNYIEMETFLDERELRASLDKKDRWEKHLPKEVQAYQIHRNEYGRVCKELGGDAFPWVNLGNERVLLNTGSTLAEIQKPTPTTGGKVKQANGLAQHEAESQYRRLGYVAAYLKCAFSELEQLAIDGRVQWAVCLDDEEIIRTHKFSRKSFKTYQGLPQELKPPENYFNLNNEDIREIDHHPNEVIAAEVWHGDKRYDLEGERRFIVDMEIFMTTADIQKAKQYIHPKEPQADQSTGKVIDSRCSLLISNFRSSLTECLTAEKAVTVESDVAKGVMRHLDENPNIPGLNALLLLKGYLEKSKQAHDGKGQTKEANQAHHLLRCLRDMAGMNPFKGIVDVALDTATPLPNGVGWAFPIANNPEYNTAYEAWHRQTLLDFNQYLIGKITESTGDKQELYQEISDQLLEFFNDPYHGLEYKAHFHDQCQYFHDWLKHKYQSMDCDRQFDNSPLKTAVKITETEFKRRLLFQHPADFLAWYREEETKSSNQVYTPSKHSRSNPKFRKRKESDTETTPQSEIPQAQYLGMSGFEGFASGQLEIRGLRSSDLQKEIAKKPRIKSRKNEERAIVEEFWDKWQVDKQLYKNVTAFDTAMMDKTGIERRQTIQTWRLNLKKGKRLTG